MYQKIKKHALGCLVYFLLLMALLGLASAKLEGLRTPWVLCCQTGRGTLEGTFYSCLVPTEALFWRGEACFVYIVEESASPFYRWQARQTPVTVQAVWDGMAAVSGIYTSGQRLVRFADMPLTENVLPVRLWTEEDA